MKTETLNQCISTNENETLAQFIRRCNQIADKMENDYSQSKIICLENDEHKVYFSSRLGLDESEETCHKWYDNYKSGVGRWHNVFHVLRDEIDIRLSVAKLCPCNNEEELLEELTYFKYHYSCTDNVGNKHHGELKYICGCGAHLRNDSWWPHAMSKKHMEYEDPLEE